MHLEVRHLRYFLAVADTQHMGRAAKRLHISQPPLTRQIQQLEQRLDVLLFKREGRGLTLTDAGRALQQDARRLLDEIEHVALNAQRVARGQRGRLRVGFVSTVLYSVLPDLVRGFRGACPEVRVDLVEATADEQLAGFAEGTLDAGFMVCPDVAPGIRLHRVHTESLLACLPSDHELARGRGPLEPRRLAGQPFITFPRERAPGLYDRIMGVAERAGFAFPVQQNAVQMQTIVGLVSAGLGVAIVPECMRNLQRPGVVYRSLKPRPGRIDTAIACTEASGTEVRDAFMNWVIEGAG